MKLSIITCFCLTAVLFLAPVHQSRAGEVLDLEAAVNMGLERNHSIQAVREALKGTEYGILSARGAFGPRLKTSYAYTRLDETPTARDPGPPPREIKDSRNVWTMNFNIYQPLFTGFNILSNFEKSRLRNEQAESQLSRAELELVLEIQNTFLDLLAARESVRVAQDSVTRLESHLNVSQSFYEVGLAPRLDVLQAQVDVAQARQDQISAMNVVGNLTARLDMLLNLPPGQEVSYQGELDFRPFNLGLEECRALALKNRPDIFIADKSVQIALKDEKITASSFYPQVGASFDYNRRGDDPTVSGSRLYDQSEWRAGVQLEWTFFEWGRTYYAHQQAEQSTRQLMEEYQDLLNIVVFEVKSSYLNIDESRQRIFVAREALAEARESYRMSQARYEAQVGTNTDVLDAQAKLSGAEANLIRASADYLKALASIYNAMGQKNISLAGY
jgi:outer membrane protein